MIAEDWKQHGDGQWTQITSQKKNKIKQIAILQQNSNIVDSYNAIV